MDAVKSVTIFDSMELFELVRDVQKRIISAHGIELTFDQVLELVKIAGDKQLLDMISEIRDDISHIASNQ